MCGVVGVIGNFPVAQKIFDALTMLQHRGQDAAGILTCDGYQMALRKSKGLVMDAIRTRHMQRLIGNLGIGHVRYPTAGSDSEAESQPFYVNSPYGISLVHNGNLTNAIELRDEIITMDNRHLNTNSDSELLLNILASSLQKQDIIIADFTADIFFKAMECVFQRANGGYAVCGIIAGAGLFAFRDPHGIRPLIYGYKNTSEGKEYMIVSESVALDCDNYTIIDDIKPGEAIFIDFKGNISRKVCTDTAVLSPCIFEYVYLARPDSVIDGVSVYGSRLRMGRKIANKILAKLPNHDIDVVIPVPDSGRHAALPIAEILGVPYSEGFVKNRYIGRTFIMPGQEERQKSIRKKLNTIVHEFKDKHVLLIDDSIVRGNTSKLIIKMARAAGAKKVSIVSASPPIRYPNVYGIDMPVHKELVAYNRSEEDVCKWIDADNVFYQTLDDLIDSITEENPKLKCFETSVFDGNYVTNDIDDDYFSVLANARNDESKKAVKSVLNFGDQE